MLGRVCYPLSLSSSYLLYLPKGMYVRFDLCLEIEMDITPCSHFVV